MKFPTKSLVHVITIACVIVLGGCAKSDQATKQKDAQKLTPEQKAAQDLQKSNDAATEVGKKIGRKLEPMDIGLPQEKKTPPPEPPKKQ